MAYYQRLLARLQVCTELSTADLDQVCPQFGAIPDIGLSLFLLIINTTDAGPASPIQSAKLIPNSNTVQPSPTVYSPVDLNSITQNGLLAGPCKPVTVIWGRESLAPGNVGLNVGPPLFKALAAVVDISKVTLQGVDYAANLIVGLAGGNKADGANMANLTEYAVAKCPGTQIVLAGYSQGAQLVRFCTNQTTALSSIKAVVTFGDPFNLTAMPRVSPSIVKVFCHPGDLLCKGLPIITLAHGGYAADTPAAAAFIASKLKF
ncbi:hypothetical protein SmJEL517_g03182 [Synchytrium microbalum]|uniref:cutinase n=1 Tax=Synchytrium microbalum TaxID=1806994 RepID=A0A507C925_9FUNG|nr:uncharacterized protein SmJEL517_g03182 [Synchytrium microbalum]TPX34043.1 hypothetical protein SmJEL517_g03182 [Synchytrium microbalum]